LRRRAFDDFVSDDAPSPRSASNSDRENELESAVCSAAATGLSDLGADPTDGPFITAAASSTISSAADAISDSSLQASSDLGLDSILAQSRAQPQLPQRIVKFVSSDGHTYFLDHSVARVSSVLAGMLLPGAGIG
jgi:hypothetical protein